MARSNAQGATAQTTPEKAATALIAEGGWVVGIATENEAGYNRLNYGPWETEDEAVVVATHMNLKAFGISEQRALMIVLSSMYPAPPHEHAIRRAAWPE